MNIIAKRVTAALVVALGISTLSAAPANAADAWGYVVVNNSVCGPGNQVRGILANVTQSGFTTTSWDNGDNIVYPRFRLNTRNQVNLQVRCEKKVALFFWQPTGFRTVVGFVTPTQNGQTFWVG